MGLVSAEELSGKTPPDPSRALSRRPSEHELVSKRAPATPKAIALNAVRNGLRAAVLGYSIRSGLLFLLRLLRVLRGKMHLQTALLESLFGQASLRMAGFFGAFAFVWKDVGLACVKPEKWWLNTHVVAGLIPQFLRIHEMTRPLLIYLSRGIYSTNNFLILHRKGKDDQVNGFLSGALAGALACLVETKQWRTDMSQQLLVRGLQAVFNSLSLNGHFSFRHGNSLIFAFATAQVMYAYTMRPTTIPDSYNKFIVTTGPIPADIILLVRQQLSGIPLDPDSVMKAVVKHKGSQQCMDVAAALPAFPDIVPCEVLHPAIEGCSIQAVWTLSKVLKTILPVYFSLNFVPMVVLKTRELLRNPQALLWRGVKNSFRSSMFLAVYVASFMRIACILRDLQRYKILPRDNRYLYWLNGFLSSWSIFIEDEKRRSELAMYVLPRGMDALYKTLYSKSLIFKIQHFDVAMFAAGMGLIIMYFQTEPIALGGIIYRLLRRVDLTIEDRDLVLDVPAEEARSGKARKIVQPKDEDDIAPGPVERGVVEGGIVRSDKAMRK